MTEWNKRQIAANYELGRPLDENIILRLFRQISKTVPLQHKTMLDAGCGTGRISVPLSLEFSSLKIVGIDKSKEMTSILRDKISLKKINNIEVMISDLSHMEFPDSYFDNIMVSSVFHSIPDWKSVIEEIMRVTKNQGHMFLISEQGDIYDLGLERRKSTNYGLMERFWGKYMELRHKYGLEDPEKTQIGLKWELGEPKLIDYLRKGDRIGTESTFEIKWKKDFTVKDSLEIIENKCWSSMFTADVGRFESLIADMKAWLREEKISPYESYKSNFILRCVVIELKYSVS